MTYFFNVVFKIIFSLLVKDIVQFKKAHITRNSIENKIIINISNSNIMYVLIINALIKINMAIIPGLIYDLLKYSDGLISKILDE